jgi:hypothetical protein
LEAGGFAIAIAALDEETNKRTYSCLQALPPQIGSLDAAVESKRRRTTRQDATPEAVNFAVRLLEDELELREAASSQFPPAITSSVIRAAVSKYEDEMSAVSKRSVCCCCSNFAAIGDIYKIYDV